MRSASRSGFITTKETLSVMQAISVSELSGRYLGDELTAIQPGTELRAEFGIRVVSVMLSAVRPYKVAILLASTVMFPRLLMQIAVVNQALMMRMVVPIMVMAATGFAVAVRYFLRSRKESAEVEPLTLSNPFSLKSALNFTLVFARS